MRIPRFSTVSTILGLVLTGFGPSVWAASTELLLIGGGAHPGEAMARFVAEAGGADARVLVVTWATDYPADAMADILPELTAVHGARALEAPRRPFTAASRAQFLSALGTSTAVFFTGGDQTKIMSVASDPAVHDALVKFYQDGHPVAGTSAGTAIMSASMFDGHESELATGLGLIPGVLLDTHFLVRNRLPRLRAALATEPRSIGLGIDQDNAIWVTNGKGVETYGAHVLTLVTTDPDGVQTVRTVGPNLQFELP